jgi:peroxiredoxin
MQDTPATNDSMVNHSAVHGDMPMSRGSDAETGGLARVLPNPASEVDDTVTSPLSTGGELSLGALTGKVPVVMAFLQDLHGDAGRSAIQSFDRRLVDFGRARAQAVIVSGLSASEVVALRSTIDGNTPIVADADGEWARSVGVAHPIDFDAVVILDHDGLVASSRPVDVGPSLADELLAELGAIVASEHDGGAGS